jgi:hypothetical protein
MGSIATADRRDPIALRRPFHASIGLGPADALDAVLADAIDLSVGGMSVRSPMLPDVGVQLEFRFMLEDGKTVDGRGEVVWTHDEGSRAGAFGVKFLAMPGDARASLRRSLEPAAKVAAAGSDTKVRLHLESMDAPFRARLRERLPGSVVVGHELSFLKLGGKVTVEGAKDNEPGVISAVEVEIDPATKTPRLVLTIDLDSGAAAAHALRVTSVAKAPVTSALIDAARLSAPPAEAAVARAEPAAVPVERGAVITKTSDAVDSAIDTARTGPEPVRAKITTMAPPAAAPSSAIDSNEDDFDDDAPAGPSLLQRGAAVARTAWDGTRRLTAPVAAGVVSGVAALRARFVRPAADDVVDAPRGGLRPQHNPALATTSDPDGLLARKRNRRVVMYAGAAAVLTVLIIAMAIGGGPSATAPHPQVAVTTDPAPVAEVVAPAPAAVGALPAEMPSEEPVPMGADGRVVAAGNNPPADLQGAVLSSAGQVENVRPVIMQGRPRAAGLAFAPAAAAARAPVVAITPGHVAAMGNPSVRVGTRLVLRMDGPVTAITGAGTRGNVISMVIPGRHSLDLAAALVRMDGRILNAGVINRAAGAELTLRFRDAAPPFFAHARGNALEVVLGSTPGAPVRRAAAAPAPAVLRVRR